jgi:hypothetical protein
VRSEKKAVEKAVKALEEINRLRRALEAKEVDIQVLRKFSERNESWACAAEMHSANVVQENEALRPSSARAGKDDLKVKDAFDRAEEQRFQEWKKNQDFEANA